MENLEQGLAVYREVPMHNGDAVIFTDLHVVIQADRLADLWDAVARVNLCAALRETGAREIALAIARPDAELLAQDHVMWADLREELRGSGVRLRDPIGLPAAA